MTYEPDQLSFFDSGGPDQSTRAERRRRQQKQRKRRRRRVVGPLLALVVVVALAGGALYGGRSLVSRFATVQDYVGSGAGSATIEVKSGDTATDIAAALVKAGVVKSERAFRNAAKNDPRSVTIQPGFYKLHLQMSGVAALTLMLDPKARLLTRLTVPEGLTVAATLELIAKRTGMKLAAVQAAAKDIADLSLPSYAKGRLEGFLFPSTYDVDPGTTPIDLLHTMVDTYKQKTDDVGLVSGASAVGLTPYQVLVVASLIERETRLPDERSKVARVIYNRLDRNFYLGVDASVLYGLGRSSGALTKSDLDKVTPYNTRLVKGLPPTPIANPGVASINGALHPAGGSWLYYVLQDKSGRHFFTADPDAFNTAAAQCRKIGLC